MTSEGRRLRQRRRLHRGLAVGERAAVVGAAVGVVAELDDGGDVQDAWFIRRLPARESPCRTCSPERASGGAVPV
jgi:hypothetical protein